MNKICYYREKNCLSTSNHVSLNFRFVNNTLRLGLSLKIPLRNQISFSQNAHVTLGKLITVIRRGWLI